MKAKCPTITLLGSNSGNNLGDAAILSGILDVITQELPDAKFYVPSTNPKFISSNYGDKYNVKAVNVMPWTGSIRLLGLPTMYCIAKSDITLICDGIIFGVKLFNPAFNFLITLVFLIPWLKLTGSKLICYSCGIGPFPSFWSKLCARLVINACDLVIMRENDSKDLAKKIGVTKAIEVTGDAAFLNEVASKERAKEIAEQEGIHLNTPILGLNVTSYIDAWLSKTEQVKDKSQFLHILAEGINKAKEKLSNPYQCILFSTHPMDEDFANQLAALVNGKVINNSAYLSHDIQAIMRESALLIGMRFHSLVLASAVEVPIIGLVYAPKVRGYMRLLSCEKYSLELAELNAELLSEKIQSAWEHKDSLKEQQQVVVNELKSGARRAAALIRKRYFG